MRRPREQDGANSETRAGREQGDLAERRPLWGCPSVGDCGMFGDRNAPSDPFQGLVIERSLEKSPCSRPCRACSRTAGSCSRLPSLVAGVRPLTKMSDRRKESGRSPARKVRGRESMMRELACVAGPNLQQPPNMGH